MFKSEIPVTADNHRMSYELELRYHQSKACLIADNFL